MFHYLDCIGEIAEAAELHDNAETTTNHGVIKRGEVANYIAVAQFLENVNLLERVGLWILNMRVCSIHEKSCLLRL